MVRIQTITSQFGFWRKKPPPNPAEADQTSRAWEESQWRRNFSILNYNCLLYYQGKPVSCPLFLAVTQEMMAPTQEDQQAKKDLSIEEIAAKLKASPDTIVRIVDYLSYQGLMNPIPAEHTDYMIKSSRDKEGSASRVTITEAGRREAAKVGKASVTKLFGTSRGWRAKQV